MTGTGKSTTSSGIRLSSSVATVGTIPGPKVTVGSIIPVGASVGVSMGGVFAAAGEAGVIVAGVGEAADHPWQAASRQQKIRWWRISRRFILAPNAA